MKDSNTSAATADRADRKAEKLPSTILHCALNNKLLPIEQVSTQQAAQLQMQQQQQVVPLQVQAQQLQRPLTPVPSNASASVIESSVPNYAQLLQAGLDKLGIHLLSN